MKYFFFLFFFPLLLSLILLFEIHTHTNTHQKFHTTEINKKTKGKNQMSKTDLDRWARWPQSAVDVVADLVVVVVVVVAVVVGADAMEVDESMDGLLFGCRPNGTTTLLKKTQDGDDLD